MTFPTHTFTDYQGVIQAEWLNAVDDFCSTSAPSLSLEDYTALRAYTGVMDKVYITGLPGLEKPAGIAGMFQYDSSDTTSVDNGGTIIVGVDGRRWKRDFDGVLRLKYFGAVADGITNDASALLRALEACRVLSASKKSQVVLELPTNSVLKITFSKGQTDTDVSKNIAAKSFYNFNSWAPDGGVWIGDQGFILEGNGSTILVDGDANSFLFSSTSSYYRRIGLRNVTFRAYNKEVASHCLNMAILWSHWENVSIVDFYNGSGLTLNGERNVFNELNIVNCRTGLRLGFDNSTFTTSTTQANENRFVSLNIIACGLSVTKDDLNNLNVGFLEINSSQCATFLGGSWKGNKVPMIIRSAFGLSFDSVYFEYNGLLMGGGAYPGDSAVPERALQLHCIFDARNSNISGFVINISNIKFKNCYFSPYCSLLWRAGLDSNSKQRLIDGVEFDCCTFGTQTYNFYETASVGFVRNVYLDGTRLWGGPVGSYPSSGTSYGSIVQEVQPNQYLVSYPVPSGQEVGSPNNQLPISVGRASLMSLVDGIKLGGDSNERLGTSNSGTFTPQMYAGGNEVAATYGAVYGTAKGEYFRIGRLVFATLAVKLSSIGTMSGTGSVDIRGLPFNASGLVTGINETEMVTVQSWGSLTSVTTPVTAKLDRTADKVSLFHNNLASYVTAANITTNTDLRVSVVYLTDGPVSP